MNTYRIIFSDDTVDFVIAESFPKALDKLEVTQINEIKAMKRVPCTKFKRLEKLAKIPSIAKQGDAGFDLYAFESVVIKKGGQAILRTGIAAEFPEGCAGFIWPRSGLATKHMLNVHAGLIDQGYRGEIMVCLINHGDKDIEVRRGDRVAQLVVSPFIAAACEVSSLSETERGTHGFGSTGL